MHHTGAIHSTLGEDGIRTVELTCKCGTLLGPGARSDRSLNSLVLELLAIALQRGLREVPICFLRGRQARGLFATNPRLARHVERAAHGRRILERIAKLLSPPGGAPAGGLGFAQPSLL